MRTILKCNRFTSLQYMLETLIWMNIRQRIELTIQTFIKKMDISNAPNLIEKLQYIAI